MIVGMRLSKILHPVQAGAWDSDAEIASSVSCHAEAEERQTPTRAHAATRHRCPERARPETLSVYPAHVNSPLLTRWHSCYGPTPV